MRRILSVIGLLAILAVMAYAQHPVIKANIPFDFVAAGIALPPGTYDFSTNDDGTALEVRNSATGKAIMVPVITRLAGESGAADNVTFDDVQGKKFLEVVWPTQGDGYLLHTTQGKHTHQTVKAAKKG